MRERCFVKVEFDPATSGSHVRRAVGGFLRYIQHRDLHPGSKLAAPTPDVAGLVKYVAYRDKASGRAQLFGPEGSFGTKERKDFVGYVARSIEGSEPQVFRTRAGHLMDRRRAVSRFLISPESAHGLDLERLARAAVSRLESEMGVGGLRWIGAIHRNTAHHHFHLVLAGMRSDAAGGFRRVDITKPRLAAIKEALGLEIERQRTERMPSLPTPALSSAPIAGGSDAPAIEAAVVRSEPPGPVRLPALAPLLVTSGGVHATTNQPSRHLNSVLALRAAARRYSRQMQRDIEREARLRGWEHAA